MIVIRALLSTLLAILCGAAPQKSREEIYKTVGKVRLKVRLYEPEGLKEGDPRPAIVFFFGGGWRTGTARQFRSHCEYLASRGVVAMAADYRVLSRHGTKADICVTDAKSAVRWVRANAERLGVDPRRIAAGGGSAGGHIAACAGTIEGFEAEGEDALVSSVPDALVLFNPALVLAPVEGRVDPNDRRLIGLKHRLGVEPEKLSPYHHVRAGAPPTLVLHGTEDAVVPYFTAELFAEAMKKAGNRCELEGYEGQEHGFHNAGNKAHLAAMKRVDKFLASLGWLEGEPAIKE